MEEEKELDDQWMKEFEIIDTQYSHFYNNDVVSINLHFIYINSDNCVQQILDQKFILSTPNIIKREELIGIIKRNFMINNKRYFLLSLLKFNFSLQPNYITSYLKNNEENNQTEFFSTVKNIDTIIFEKTVSLFQDLNDLFFLFYEKVVGITPTIPSDFYTRYPSYHSLTKRIYLKKSHRKTQRK